MKQSGAGHHDRGKIKVRWVTYWPVPYWTERFNALAERPEIDLDVVFLSSRSELLAIDLDEENWKFKYQVVRNEVSKSGYAAVYKRLPRPWKLVEGEFDYLIMPYGDPDCVAAAFMCRLLRKPYVLFVANNRFDWRPASFFRDFLKRYIYDHTVACLATGSNQLEYAHGYLSRHQVSRVIGNPAPCLNALSELSSVRIREEIRRELGWTDKLVLLFVGRLAEEKGLFDLMASLPDPRIEGKQIHTVLVGIGPCEEALRNMATESDLSVEFKGWVTGESLTKLYVSADLFILPSHSEPWGLVVNEAMEAGLPVIISANVGSGESLVRHGYNGFIFETGNVAEMAGFITELAGNQSLRSNMGARGREIVAEHSIENWSDAVVSSVTTLSSMAI